MRFETQSVRRRTEGGEGSTAGVILWHGTLRKQASLILSLTGAVCWPLFKVFMGGGGEGGRCVCV